MARFLERLWRDQRPHRKTDLQLAVRLNYNVYRKYLDWMGHKGLITVDEFVSITPKGLATYHSLVAWIKETVGEDHL